MVSKRWKFSDFDVKFIGVAIITDIVEKKTKKCT